MAFWWPLLVLAFAYGICRFLFMLIPPSVPSIDVDASDVLEDGNKTQENSFIYVPPRGNSQQSSKIVQCYEPATMKYLGYVPALTYDEAAKDTGPKEDPSAMCRLAAAAIRTEEVWDWLSLSFLVYSNWQLQIRKPHCH